MRIAQTRVVDVQTAFRALNERGQFRPRIDGTNQQGLRCRFVRLPVRVRVEESDRLVHQTRHGYHDAKTAAVVNVERSEVKSQQIEGFSVHEQHFAMVAGQITGRSGNRYSGPQEARFELAQIPLASMVGPRDKGLHHHAPAYSPDESFLNLRAVEAKDQNFHTLLSLVDSLHQRCDSVLGLGNQAVSGLFCFRANFFLHAFWHLHCK